jgi:hypothetical protein
LTLALSNGDAAGRLDVASNGGRDATAGCQQAEHTATTCEGKAQALHGFLAPSFFLRAKS